MRWPISDTNSQMRFFSVRSPCITGAMHWSLEIFIRHLATAVPLLETDNISPVCRYIFEKWPVLIACNWKTSVMLASFSDKISIFHLGQTEHCLACSDGPLCEQHRALISFIWCRATQWTREYESPELSRFSPPSFEFCTVSSPLAGRVFEWAITQLDVREDPWLHIDQLCVRDLTSTRAFAAAKCCGRQRARRHRSPTFWGRASQWVSSRAASCSY